MQKLKCLCQLCNQVQQNQNIGVAVSADSHETYAELLIWKVA